MNILPTVTSCSQRFVLKDRFHNILIHTAMIKAICRLVQFSTQVQYIALAMAIAQKTSRAIQDLLHCPIWCISMSYAATRFSHTIHLMHEPSDARTPSQQTVIPAFCFTVMIKPRPRHFERLVASLSWAAMFCKYLHHQSPIQHLKHFLHHPGSFVASPCDRCSPTRNCRRI